MDRDPDEIEDQIVRRLSVTTFPPTAIVLGATAMTEGGLKYGFNNFDVRGGSAIEHADGAVRHILRWLEGEEVDEHGIPNLGLALGRLAILVDLRERKMLIDDRPPRVALSPMIERGRKLIGRLMEARTDHGAKIQRYTQLQPNPEEPKE